MTQTDVEQLLKPRYECIAGFWNNPFEIGQIIEMTGKSTRFPLLGEDNIENWEAWIDGKKGGATCYSITQFENYPHLFRKLHWAEKRNLEDTPEYVKGINSYFTDKVYKVAHPSQNGREWHVDNEIEHQYFFRYASDFIPVTLEDFTNYLNQITHK